MLRKLGSLVIFFAWSAWLALVGIPLGFLFLLILSGENRALLWDPTLLFVAGATLSQAFWSTLGSAFVGVGLGLWVGALPSRRFRVWIQTLLSFPYGVPVVVAASAWIFWLGRSGVLAGFLAPFGFRVDWVYSFKAVILAHVFLNAPWIAMMVAEARAQISRDEVEAGVSLGAGRLGVFQHLIWPKIGWTVLTACTQVFIFCSMSFALVLILGGGPPVQTLETEIFQRIRFTGVDLEGAAACAFWQLLVTLVPWLFLLGFRKKLGLNFVENHSDRADFQHEHRDLSFSPGVLAVTALFVLPYFPVLNLHQSWLVLSGPDQSLILRAVGLSLAIALSSSLLSVLLAGGFILSLERVSRWPRLQKIMIGLVVLPGSVSALVLGLSGWLAYEKWLDWSQFPLAAIILLQMILFSPFVFRTLWPLTRGSLRDQTESALNLGASSFQLLRWIKWPYWKSPLTLTFFGVAGASLGEIAAVSLFSNEAVLPLPVLASQWMEQYRFEDAIGASGLLFLLAFIFVLSPVLVRGGFRIRGNSY